MTKGLVVLSIVMILFGCTESTEKADSLFHSLSSEETGVVFENTLQANLDQNIFNYMYFYNGAGVGAGDFDNDGLVDLYFAGNQVQDALYKNLGRFKFEEVTLAAGIDSDSLWSTGVSVADVNADGKLDIFVSVVSPLSTSAKSHSRLYINESEVGHIRFTEQSVRYGLDLKGYGTQALFIDATADGILETYQLRHSVHSNGTFGPRDRLLSRRDSLAGDMVLQLNKGVYQDRSLAFKVNSSALGYGLGIVSSDFNSDGYPDVYIANDFHEDDYLYLNQNGDYFKESLRKSIPHTSRFTMGVDAEDINQDGIPDIVSLDMLPFQHDILKASAGEDPYDVWKLKLRNGYWPQYSRNMLQMSKGMHPDSNGIPLFSDLGLLTGIAATDWSWSVLLKDFDLDGDPDVFITNGIYGRSNDMDYIKFISNPKNQARIKANKITPEDLALADQMPVVKLENQLFLNSGGGKYQSPPILLGGKGFSHGSITVDLDNDGDVDLVTSDVNGAAQILENRTISHDVGPSWIGLQLQQEGGNRSAIGSKVSIVGQKTNDMEVQAVRGFLSSSDTRLILPANQLSLPVTIRVVWSDRNTSEHVLDSNALNTYSVIKQVLGEEVEPSEIMASSTPFKTKPASFLGINFQHKENNFNEFNRQALLLEMTSEEGPALAVGDMNGDGLDDLFFGGAKGQSAELWSQTPEGMFSKRSILSFETDRIYEDVDALFIDYDADGDKDLLVLSGGAEYPTSHVNHSLRLYINTDGDLIRDVKNSLNEIRLVGSRLVLLESSDEPLIAVVPRTQTDLYGVPTPGYILRINEAAEFQDVTESVAPWFSNLCMITDAITVSQGDENYLVLARDWGPVTAHKVTKHKVEYASIMLAPSGFWRSIVPVYSRKGKLDHLILGNLGLNSKFQPSEEAPMKMYVSDFDQNGSTEQIVTTSNGGQERLFATRDEVIKQLVSVRKKAKSYTAFANASFDELIPPSWQKSATQYTITQTRSGLVSPSEKGFGAFQSFPNSAQESTIRTGAILGGKIVLAGNTSAVNIQRGVYDASYGLVLDALDISTPEVNTRPDQTGIFLPGVTQTLKSCIVGSDTVLIAARNNKTPLIIVKR